MLAPMWASLLLGLLDQPEVQQKSLWAQFALGGPYQMLRVSLLILAKPSYLMGIGKQYGNRQLSMHWPAYFGY
jgi:hypothetical protein